MVFVLKEIFKLQGLTFYPFSLCHPVYYNNDSLSDMDSEFPSNTDTQQAFLTFLDHLQSSRITFFYKILRFYRHPVFNFVIGHIYTNKIKWRIGINRIVHTWGIFGLNCLENDFDSPFYFVRVDVASESLNELSLNSFFKF